MISGWVLSLTACSLSARSVCTFCLHALWLHLLSARSLTAPSDCTFSDCIFCLHVLWLHLLSGRSLTAPSVCTLALWLHLPSARTALGLLAVLFSGASLRFIHASLRLCWRMRRSIIRIFPKRLLRTLHCTTLLRYQILAVSLLI